MSDGRSPFETVIDAVDWASRSAEPTPQAPGRGVIMSYANGGLTSHTSPAVRRLQSPPAREYELVRVVVLLRRVGEFASVWAERGENKFEVVKLVEAEPGAHRQARPQPDE